MEQNTNQTKLSELRARWTSLVSSSLPDSAIDEELQQLEDAMDALPSEWEAIPEAEAQVKYADLPTDEKATIDGILSQLGLS